MKAPPSKYQRDYVSSSPVRRGKYQGENTVYATRRLKVYAFDPQLGRRERHRISMELPFEPLAPGPQGRLVRVVDYDAVSGRYYRPVNLDEAELRAAGGLEPTVDNPQFHQQMVYAVAMKVVENFERALGRRLSFTKPLTVLPHAFEGRNAFFEPVNNALCFGYFRADPDEPGENIPNQLIFTCLSHDIVAHEMAHAVVHRLRKHYREPTNADVYAFHEAIADIVAIFQHFSFPGVLRDSIQENRADLSKPGRMIELARQFGHATGSGEALRKARDDEEEPDPDLYAATFEPHDRGSVLVRAVFDAFFTTFGARVEDLLRIATGGSGVLGEGYLHPDLVNRLAAEAADTAQRVLDLCIRAFEYLPPVDVTFSDYLRSLVTADSELNPEDPLDLRANLVDSFLARGVYPEAFSLNEESLLWPSAVGAGLDPLDGDIVAGLLSDEAQSWGSRSRREVKSIEATRLHEYASANWEALGFQEPSDELPIAVRGFHSMFRIGSDGQLLTEASVQYTQTSKAGRDDALGGLTPRAGTTVIFSGDGSPRYIVSKPLPHDGLDEDTRARAEARLEDMQQFVARSDDRDPHNPWGDDDDLPAARRMLRRYDFAAVHQQIRRRRSEKGDSS